MVFPFDHPPTPQRSGPEAVSVLVALAVLVLVVTVTNVSDVVALVALLPESKVTLTPTPDELIERVPGRGELLGLGGALLGPAGKLPGPAVSDADSLADGVAPVLRGLVLVLVLIKILVLVLLVLLALLALLALLTLLTPVLLLLLLGGKVCRRDVEGTLARGVGGEICRGTDDLGEVFTVDVTTVVLEKLVTTVVKTVVLVIVVDSVVTCDGATGGAELVADVADLEGLEGLLVAEVELIERDALVVGALATLEELGRGVFATALVTLEVLERDVLVELETVLERDTLVSALVVAEEVLERDTLVGALLALEVLDDVMIGIAVVTPEVGPEGRPDEGPDEDPVEDPEEDPEEGPTERLEVRLEEGPGIGTPVSSPLVTGVGRERVLVDDGLVLMKVLLVPSGGVGSGVAGTVTVTVQSSGSVVELVSRDVEEPTVGLGEVLEPTALVVLGVIVLVVLDSVALVVELLTEVVDVLVVLFLELENGGLMAVGLGSIVLCGIDNVGVVEVVVLVVEDVMGVVLLETVVFVAADVVLVTEELSGAVEDVLSGAV